MSARRDEAAIPVREIEYAGYGNPPSPNTSSHRDEVFLSPYQSDDEEASGPVASTGSTRSDQVAIQMGQLGLSSEEERGEPPLSESLDWEYTGPDPHTHSIAQLCAMGWTRTRNRTRRALDAVRRHPRTHMAALAAGAGVGAAITYAASDTSDDSTSDKIVSAMSHGARVAVNVFSGDVSAVAGASAGAPPRGRNRPSPGYTGAYPDPK